MTLYGRMPPSSDAMNWWSIFERKDYKPVCDLFPDKTAPLNIVDVGAYVGYATAYFRNQFPNAKINCFEGDIENYALLRMNIGNDLNILSVRQPVWDRDAWLVKKADFRDGKEWSYYWEESVCGDTKPVTMSSICSAIRGDINILKIDIEGGERFLFRDDSFLEKCKVVAIEIHDEFNCRNIICDAFKKHGFKYWDNGELTIAQK